MGNAHERKRVELMGKIDFFLRAAVMIAGFCVSVLSDNVSTQIRGLSIMIVCMFSFMTETGCG